MSPTRPVPLNQPKAQSSPGTTPERMDLFWYWSDQVHNQPLAQCTTPEAMEQLGQLLTQLHPEVSHWRLQVTLWGSPRERAIGDGDALEPTCVLQARRTFPVQTSDQNWGWVELTGPNEDNIIPAFVERLEVPLRLTLRLVAESLKRKHAQEVLENELRGFSLASGAAVHEIRNPLGLIQFQLDFLKLRLEAQPSSTPSLAGELPAGQDFSGVFRDVNAEIDRIARHLDDLSALAQYGASELKIERQPGDLIPILRRLVERMNHKFEARGTRCTILVEVPVLEGAWDFFRIEQVLTNLLSNACKYGNGKPVSVSVTLEGDLYSSVCVIRVKDQGTGISDEDQTQILRHFFRSKSHRSQRGLGLGLYVCDKLVTLMEGRLEVQSTPNQGTEVSVRLPMTLNAP